MIFSMRNNERYRKDATGPLCIIMFPNLADEGQEPNEMSPIIAELCQ